MGNGRGGANWGRPGSLNSFVRIAKVLCGKNAGSRNGKIAEENPLYGKGRFLFGYTHHPSPITCLSEVFLYPAFHLVVAE